MDPETMTTRERFRRVMHFEKPDRLPNFDFGYWAETLDTWKEQGLPAEVTNGVEAEKFFGLEGTEQIGYAPIAWGIVPPFEYKVLEERGTKRIVQDHDGVICEVSTAGASIPRYLKYPIETREDWEVFKHERLDFENTARVFNVREAVDAAHAAGMPVRFNPGSLYGHLRNWIGVENFSILLMEEEDLAEEMMDHLTEMTLYLIEKGVRGVDIDVAWWWEDMCYNHGPLLSPHLFHKLMVPRYKRVTAALRDVGIDVNVLDSDGCIYELAAGWLEAGINCLFPIEALHTDPLELRRRFPEDLRLMGGVNKMELAKGRDAIDRELERLRPLVDAGGYIPTVDHRVPPDVSMADYQYYLERRAEVLLPV